VALGLLGLSAQPALGDGDPASDVLIGANIFYPYEPVQASVERALNAATAALARHGQPIKLAIIASPEDLGAIPQAFNMPQAYAAFLDVELSYYDPHGPLLVVMPAGFGAEHFSIRALGAIRSQPKPGSQSATALVTAALAAEAAIARVDGFSITSPTDTVSPGSGTHTLWEVLLAGLAAIGSLGLILTSRPVRRRRSVKGQLIGRIPYADPDAPPRIGARLIGRVANSELIASLSTTRLWRGFVLKLDALLMHATNGRLSAVTMTVPSGLLETTGARSGLARRAPVIYFHDGERVTFAASNAGLPMAPAWYYNLLATPAVRFNGEAFQAMVVSDPGEQDRLWQLADRVFPAYASYRARAARAGRVIPIIQLLPSSPEPSQQAGSGASSVR